VTPLQRGLVGQVRLQAEGGHPAAARPEQVRGRRPRRHDAVDADVVVVVVVALAEQHQRHAGRTRGDLGGRRAPRG
jgi:hypothetical protein